MYSTRVFFFLQGKLHRPRSAIVTNKDAASYSKQQHTAQRKLSHCNIKSSSFHPN